LDYDRIGDSYEMEEEWVEGFSMKGEYLPLFPVVNRAPEFVF